MTLLLSRGVVKSLLDMAEAIAVMETAFADFAQNGIEMPRRQVISVPQRGGQCGFMPAYVQRTGALGIKTVTAFRDNVSRYQLPTILGTLTLLDDQTGEPVTIMDGAYLTSVRTGAASGVATRHLARQDAHILGILGSGKQAETQIWAVCQVRPITEVRVFSPHLQQRQDAFQQAVSPLVEAEIRVVDTAAAAVRDCDIVVLATNATRPVIDGEWLAPGTHVNGIGSHSPSVRELDTRSVQRAKIVCDSLDACLAEAGDLMIPIAEGVLRDQDIHGDLGQVVCREIEGRSDDEEITIFKSVGLAFQDIAMAQYVYQKATDQVSGTHFDFSA